MFSVRSGLRLEPVCVNSLSGGHSGLALGRTSFCVWSGLQGLQCVQSQQHRLWWHCFQQWKHPNCQRYKQQQLLLLSVNTAHSNLHQAGQTKLHKIICLNTILKTSPSLIMYIFLVLIKRPYVTKCIKTTISE